MLPAKVKWQQSQVSAVQFSTFDDQHLTSSLQELVAQEHLDDGVSICQLLSMIMNFQANHLVIFETMITRNDPALIFMIFQEAK